MGLMDKVKSQATQLAEKAQQAGQAGQSKLADIQSKRKADALLLELGGIVYSQKVGRADAGAEARTAELVSELQAIEAEHGTVAVTVASAESPASASPAPPSTGPLPQAQYGSDQS